MALVFVPVGMQDMEDQALRITPLPTVNGGWTVRVTMGYEYQPP